LGIFPFGVENVEFERVLGTHYGIALYWARSGFAVAKISDVNFQVSEQRISYRFYLGKNAPQGFWVGENIAYSTGDVWKGSDYAYDRSVLAFSIESGYRLIRGNFNIAPFAMIRLTITDNLLGTKRTNGDVKMPLAGLGLGISVGWGW
jgi:hypothetical protein